MGDTHLSRASGGFGVDRPLAGGNRTGHTANPGQMSTRHIVLKALASTLQVRRIDLSRDHPDVRGVSVASLAMALAPLTRNHEHHHAN